MIGSNRILENKLISHKIFMTEDSLLHWAQTSQIAKCFVLDVLPPLSLPVYDFDGRRIQLDMHEFTLEQLEEATWHCLSYTAMHNVVKINDVAAWFYSHDLQLSSFVIHNGLTIAVAEPENIGVLTIQGNRAGVGIFNQYGAISISNIL